MNYILKKLWVEERKQEGCQILLKMKPNSVKTRKKIEFFVPKNWYALC